jgi:hypothetical protein
MKKKSAIPPNDTGPAFHKSAATAVQVHVAYGVSNRRVATAQTMLALMN